MLSDKGSGEPNKFVEIIIEIEQTNSNESQKNKNKAHSKEWQESILQF